jgi:hypothetical protein
MVVKNKFPAESTYVAPFTINNPNGSRKALTRATVEYKLTTVQGGGETVVQYTDNSDQMVVHPENDDGEPQEGVVKVTVPAEELTEVGELWEEVRVSIPDGGSVRVVQRSVYFEPSSTSPP